MKRPFGLPLYACALLLFGPALLGCISPFALLQILFGPATVSVQTVGIETTEAVYVGPVERVRIDHGGYALGNPDVPVSVLLFVDFACIHCQTYEREVMQRFVTEQVNTGKARLEVYLFPTAGGDTSRLAGRVLECADRLQPGSFWGLYPVMFSLAESDNYNGAAIQEAAARNTGLSEDALAECAADAEAITASAAYARSLDVSGTPAVRVRYGDGDPTIVKLNGLSYAGGGVPYDVLATVVDEAH